MLSDSKPDNTAQRRKSRAQTGKINALRKLLHSGMAQHTQDAEAAADQEAEQDPQGIPVFRLLPSSALSLPAFQLAQQQFPVFRIPVQKISPACHPPVRPADLTDQRGMGTVFLDAFHLQNLIRPSGNTRRLGKSSQKLLGFQDPLSIGEKPLPIVCQISRV